MAINYKVPQATAQAMVEQWVGMTPEIENVPPAQLNALISHFTTAIQQDGSHTAFLDYANSLAKQPGATAQTVPNFTQAVANFTQQNGRAPYTPATGAVQNQLPGTNTKSGGAIIGQALTSPVGQVVEGVIAGALDVVSDGALTPVTTAGLAALQGIGQGIQPGANFGTIAKGTLTGAAEGLGAGAASGVLSGALGLGSGAAGAAGTATGAGAAAGVDLSGLTPAEVASLGDATSGTAAAAAGGVDWTAGLTATQIAAAGNAGTGVGLPGAAAALGAGSAGAGSGTGSGVLGTGLSTADLLKLGGSALTAGTNYAQDAAALAEKEREFNATNALNTQNTAVTEGNDAVSTQNKLNTAPLADKSQYLLNASLSAPPAPFQPRDITQPGGANNLNMPATGGAADQLAANQAAAAKYTPGAGGVDTSTLQLLLNKLKGSGSAFGQMPTTSSTTG